MNLNTLMTTAAGDRHDDDAPCCRGNFCKDCGAHVSGYNCNAALLDQRPEAEGWDWWLACDNADCKNARGEGLFQSLPKWVGKTK